jgi:hypothetical protein
VPQVLGSAPAQPTPGNTNPVASAARTLGNYRGTGATGPFVNRTFEWGVVIATLLSILRIVPRHWARLPHVFHELRKTNAVLFIPQLITRTLYCLQRSGLIPPVVTTTPYRYPP